MPNTNQVDLFLGFKAEGKAKDSFFSKAKVEMEFKVNQLTSLTEWKPAASVTSIWNSATLSKAVANDWVLIVPAWNKIVGALYFTIGDMFIIGSFQMLKKNLRFMTSNSRLIEFGDTQMSTMAAKVARSFSSVKYLP